MGKQEFLDTQTTCVLRVSIHCDCDGCRNKVKKLLFKIDGVYTVKIDGEQGKVTVAGNVDPALLINQLKKSGKHAELLGGGKVSQNSNNKGGGKVQQQQNGGNGQQIHKQNHQHKKVVIKGSKDHKSAVKKLNLPGPHDAHDGRYRYDDGNLSDDDDSTEDEDGHGPDDVLGHAHIHADGGKDKGSAGGSNAKKGGGFYLPALLKVIAGGNNKSKGQGAGGGATKNGGKGGGGGNNGNGGKGGGPKEEEEDSREINVPPRKGKGNGKGKGNVGQMAHFVMGHHNIPPAHGPPANQGTSSAFDNHPYNQLQDMTMNQQQMNGEGMHQQKMMYGQLPPPPPVYGPFTHMFSDDNTGSCSIM
ncbi:hypothetical protein Dimus_021725 [Dionaea muscipula]